MEWVMCYREPDPWLEARRAERMRIKRRDAGEALLS